MPKNYVNYVPMCKKRKSRFYLFHVPKGICKLKTMFILPQIGSPIGGWRETSMKTLKITPLKSASH